MNDSLEFEEDENKESGSNWQMGLKNTGSFDFPEGIKIEQQNLQILHKKEVQSQEAVIPATLQEKLSYYRAFASSTSKTQIVSIQQIRFNRFLWFYIFNVFCKSLPSTYVYVFLGLYAADNHFFISKMIPIAHGCVWCSIISALFGLLIYGEHVALLWKFFICGVLYKNPWNRCDVPMYTFSNITFICYKINDFIQKVQNQSMLFWEKGYTLDSASYEKIQMAPILYNIISLTLKDDFMTFYWMYEVGVFIVTAALHRQVFKKFIWKMLHYSQLALNFMFLASFVHLVICYFHISFDKVQVPVDDLALNLWDADIDILAESMTGPPVVHVLTSRGTEKVNPSRHSTMIVASNAAYYIFRGLLSYMLKRYCENVVGASIQISQFNPYSSFFLWPIYFSFFYLGDFYSVVFFMLNAITEFLVLVITYHCLVEAIASEWRWTRRWCIVSLLCALECFTCIASGSNFRGIIYVYCTSIATLAEVIALYCIYPLGRLVDDITFHCGAPPTKLRILNLRFVPVYYSIKIFTLLKVFMKILYEVKFVNYVPYYIELLYLQLMPLIVAAIYVAYEIVYKRKEGWKQLFVPVSEWGPKDFVTRQLRKQYDSRHITTPCNKVEYPLSWHHPGLDCFCCDKTLVILEVMYHLIFLFQLTGSMAIWGTIRKYIVSQAPRDLSRYFIEKAELKTYKVDIQYGDCSRHSTLQSEVHIEEKKVN